jgi:putative transposase
MTSPRAVHAGATYLMTRRCLNRLLLLRPSATVTQVFAYVLARAAKRTGVQVHAFCVLSNHYHLVVSDPQARLPEFAQYLDSLVARATNALLGRWEHFWGGHSYSAVALGSAEDIVSKVAYALANPVAAGLVEAGHLWPGLWSNPADFGTTVRVRRPDHFFDSRGQQPEWEDLELVVPVGFLSADDFRAQAQAELSRQEQAAREEDHGCLGVQRVLAVSAHARPRVGEPRRGLSPRVAARDRWRRMELLQRLKSFLTDYADALRLWREGKVEPVFPSGTYLMRVAHGVACAEPA